MPSNYEIGYAKAMRSQTVGFMTLCWIPRDASTVPRHPVLLRDLARKYGKGSPRTLERCLQELQVLHMTRSMWRKMSATWRSQAGTITYLEDGLHLGELGPWMLTRQHLYHQAPDTPDISFASVSSLFHHFRCHPEDGTLKRGSMCSVPRHEVSRETSAGSCRDITRVSTHCPQLSSKCRSRRS